MFKTLRQSILMLLALTVITGVAYPAMVTLLAQVVFPHQANGSLIERDGKVIGSELIGQQFDAPQYFWGRPSATSPAYNAESSTGSNLGPTNPAQLDAVRNLVAAIRKANPDQSGPVPIDLVTASASGLDPHITRAAACYQAACVAKARNLSIEAVQKAIAENTENRTLGLLGEPRVNVLKLNLALDASQK